MRPFKVSKFKYIVMKIWKSQIRQGKVLIVENDRDQRKMSLKFQKPRNISRIFQPYMILMICSWNSQKLSAWLASFHPESGTPYLCLLSTIKLAKYQLVYLMVLLSIVQTLFTQHCIDQSCCNSGHPDVHLATNTTVHSDFRAIHISEIKCVFASNIDFL